MVLVLTQCSTGPSAKDRLEFAAELGRVLRVEGSASAGSVDRGATSCDAATLQGRTSRGGEDLAEVLDRSGFATAEAGAGISTRRSGMVATIDTIGSEVFITVVDEGC